MLMVGVMPLFAQQNGAFITPEAAKADEDFAIQGEYVGDNVGLQVIARGSGDFELVLYNGGLPGAGWDRTAVTRVDGDAESVEQVLKSKGLKRIERQSPTLGIKPPSNAIVLFDGTKTVLEQRWNSGARITPDGLLMQGATTKDSFGDYTLHLEFRTPYEPTKQGQGRGNSGVYHQSRYETQVLDSFGLEGKNNETGGIYSIRDPNLNMCFPPLSWQTYDIQFTAARYDSSGQKTSDAKITVRLNGVVVQQDVALPHITTAAPEQESNRPGPLHLQDHGNDVRYRNIWLVPRNADLEAQRPMIPGYEKFASDKSAGKILISQLGCTACHASDDATLSPKTAPILDRVGSRVRLDHILGFVQSPRTSKTGTTMPDMLHASSDADRTAKAKAIASFLSTTGSVVDKPGDTSALARGKELFHSIGCTACHSPRIDGVDLRATSVPLGDLTSKYTLESLSKFLNNPMAVRPSGHMPRMVANYTEARDLACYLIGEAIIAPSSEQWNAKIYYGSWDKLPDFEKLTVAKQTTTVGLDLTATGKTSEFAMQFEAFLPISTPGEYRFYLGSDDGSRLWIDGKQVVDHDGIHPMSFRDRRIKLDAGVHTIRVDYFEKGGEEVLAVEVEGPDSGRSPISSWITSDPAGNMKSELIPNVYKAQSELIETGRQLFTSTGCANCHTLNINDKPMVSQISAKPLRNLEIGKGCLAENVPANAPNYQLSPDQKSAIADALKNQSTSNKDDAQNARDSVHFVLANANCYACHVRDNVGGPEELRNAFFKTTTQEMGNEGRLPPSLTGVGDKLRPEVIDDIIRKGAKDRPYVLTRMPGFGDSWHEGLRDKLVAIDMRESKERKPHFQDSEEGKELITAGRKLVGGDGLACIKCHRFGAKATPGIQAIDMLRMTERLREDWFHRYMLAPTEYRPGTRMPLSFPEGKSVLTSVFDGDADKQIDAMWLYLSQGKSARTPMGLDAEAIVLAPSTKPIIYRNFIEGLGPRGIAVGYPERINIAWDAGNMNLKLLWKNDFIDAAKHWVGRGPGFQTPLGDFAVDFESQSPFAILEKSDSNWPSQTARQRGYRFLGYSLNDKNQPVFKYQFDGVEVSDEVTPKMDGKNVTGLDRKWTVVIRKGTKGLTLRAAAGPLTPGEAGAFMIDNKVQVKVNGVDMKLLDIQGKKELRGELPADGTIVITETILW